MFLREKKGCSPKMMIFINNLQQIIHTDGNEGDGHLE